MKLRTVLVAIIGMMVATALALALLKVAGVVSWSWWMVAAPLWAPWMAVAEAAALLLFGMLVDWAIQGLERWAAGNAVAAPKKSPAHN